MTKPLGQLCNNEVLGCAGSSGCAQWRCSGMCCQSACPRAVQQPGVRPGVARCRLRLGGTLQLFQKGAPESAFSALNISTMTSTLMLQGRTAAGGGR